MNPDKLPLLDLFNRLREHGLPLGIEEYMVVLHALQAGFGIEDLQTLKKLCQTVWLKTEEEEDLFDQLFEQMLAKVVVHSHGPSPSVSKKPLSEASSEPSPPVSLPSIPRMQSRLKLDIEEPVQTAKALRHSTQTDLEIRRPRYSLLTEYFPVTQRQMKQSWRHLRRPVREGPPEELDVMATVERIGHEGLLLEPVLIPRRSNRAKLVLLIDQDGSMVPFHSLSRQLVETVRRGGRLRQTKVYYFHNYPRDYLYCDSTRQEAQLISEILEVIGERAAVLILSDAGAARGNINLHRIERTQEFIQNLKQYVRCLAWLNPMPNSRWANTSAGKIARFVPMFEMSRHGLDSAISALQGRYVYWEKIYPWMET